MPFFKLLEGGSHTDTNKDGKTGKDARVFNRGDIFESLSELDVKFNSPGSIKFERIHDINQVPVQNRLSVKTQQSSNTENPKPSDDKGQSKSDSTTVETVDTMTLEELKKFAEAEEINISPAKNDKNQIIKIIKGSFKSTTK